MKTLPMIIIFATAAMTLGNVWADQNEAGDSAAAAPIYDPDPSHLWNRLHHVFFARPDVDLDSDVVDPPLWPDTSGFLKTGARHETAITVLDEFLTKDGHALIADSLKKAVLQHDLWAVFDWSASSRSAEPNADLRSRLALAIRRLALSPEEIAALPDNLANSAAAGVFANDFDLENPKEPFLPTDLLDPEGSWICVRGAIDGPIAPVHTQYYQGRSPFLVFIQVPGGRAPTLKYLAELNQATQQVKVRDSKDLPQFPVGTKTALLRQMTAIDDAGQIQVTPLTQTLQMRIYRQVGTGLTDHENIQAAVKFRMKRSSLFAEGHGGLVPIGLSEPLRVSLLQTADVYDRETEGTGIKTTMQSCIACHSCGGGGTIHSIFTYKQDEWVPGGHQMAPSELRLMATNAAQESKDTVNWKKSRYEWGLLVGLLEER